MLVEDLTSGSSSPGHLIWKPNIDGAKIIQAESATAAHAFRNSGGQIKVTNRQQLREEKHLAQLEI